MARKSIMGQVLKRKDRSSLVQHILGEQKVLVQHVHLKCFPRHQTSRASSSERRQYSKAASGSTRREGGREGGQAGPQRPPRPSSCSCCSHRTSKRTTFGRKALAQPPPQSRGAEAKPKPGVWLRLRLRLGSPTQTSRHSSARSPSLGRDGQERNPHIYFLPPERPEPNRVKKTHLRRTSQLSPLLQPTESNAGTPLPSSALPAHRTATSSSVAGSITGTGQTGHASRGFGKVLFTCDVSAVHPCPERIS